jgi:hypothetical protein
MSFRTVIAMCNRVAVSICSKGVDAPVFTPTLWLFPSELVPIVSWRSFGDIRLPSGL